MDSNLAAQLAKLAPIDDSLAGELKPLAVSSLRGWSGVTAFRAHESRLPATRSTDGRHIDDVGLLLKFMDAASQRHVMKGFVPPAPIGQRAARI